MLVHELLDEFAACAPHKIALVTDDGERSAATLALRSRRLASYLRALGVGRGDRVLVLLPNGEPVVAAVMAASRLGAIYCVVHPGTKGFHLRHIVEDSAPAVVLTTRQLRAELPADLGSPRVVTVDEEADRIDAAPVWQGAYPGISSDPVSLIYTSGSTGKPKAVVSSHRNVRFAAAAIQERLGIGPDDVIGNFLPLSFDYGLYQLFLALQAGATLALGHESDTGPRLLSKLSAWKVTGLPLVPSMASNLIRLRRRAAAAPSTLRFVTNTGAHLPESYIRDLRELFPDVRVFVMFGLTECKRVSILTPEEYERKAGSVGRPLADTECLIVDEEGRALPPGRVGELVVRGPHVMLGYWRAPELDRLRYRPWGFGGERALYSGDQCSLDDEGYLYFHGRRDDVYKQSGFRVSALEIEDAACDIPGVRQAALLPPSGARGAVLFAVTDLSQTAVVAGLRERLEDHKVPGEIVVLAEGLPLTLNGKADKKALLARLEVQA